MVWTPEKRAIERLTDAGFEHYEVSNFARDLQTRLECKRTGPAEWLVVTRRPLTDDRTWEPRASREATDQDERARKHTEAGRDLSHSVVGPDTSKSLETKKSQNRL